MSKVQFLIEKYGITALSNDNLELFVSEIFNDGYQACKDKSLAKQALRDHFAGLAMQGLLTTDDGQEWGIGDIADVAYQQADAMIAERNKHHKERHETFGEEGDE